MELTAQPLSFYMSSPVMLSSPEIWTFTMDMTKVWLDHKTRGNLKDKDDETHGGRITGEKSISVVLKDMYDFMLAKKNLPKHFKDLTEKTCKNYEYTNILRFIRNFGQHAAEREDTKALNQYFPFGYTNKQKFVQNIIEWLPDLLIYIWYLEKQIEVQKAPENVTLSKIFFRCLEECITEFSNQNRVCSITYRVGDIVDGHTVQLDVVSMNDPMFERLYGSVITTFQNHQKTIIIVCREHRENDYLEFDIDKETNINVVFGAHKLNFLQAHESTTLFLQNTNVQDLTQRLDADGIRYLMIPRNPDPLPRRQSWP